MGPQDIVAPGLPRGKTWKGARGTYVTKPLQSDPRRVLEEARPEGHPLR